MTIADIYQNCMPSGARDASAFKGLSRAELSKSKREPELTS